MADNPAFTIGLAMVIGMLAQTFSRHIRLPGIVILLGAGILFGPDGLNWVRPASLGPAMHIIVGFAVAVILFEGGMNLRISRIRREQTVIRGLITIGALISMIGGTIATKFILNWDWRSAILFGTLIIVTGPTVISPLVRRIRMDHGGQHRIGSRRHPAGCYQSLGSFLFKRCIPYFFAFTSSIYLGNYWRHVAHVTFSDQGAHTRRT